MRKDGFTLAELMAVIVIIGVLAALSISKFNFAINKAKASELPGIMAQIQRAQEIFEMEENTYAAVADDVNWKDNLKSELGLEVEPKYFIFYIDNVTNTTFTAHGRAKAAFGEIPNNTVEATVDQDGTKAYVNDANGALKSYTLSWYSN